MGVKLFNFLECNNLSQLIEEPTRITLSGETLLDLIITDSPGYCLSSGTLSPPANCDHNIVYAKFNIDLSKPKAFRRSIRLYKNLNTRALIESLANAHWDIVFGNSPSDIDVVYDNWFKLFKNVVDLYIPCKQVTIRPKDKPWMNSLIRRNIRKRDRFLKKFSLTKNSVLWERYRRQRNFVVTIIKRAKKDYNDKINRSLANPATSSKKWWNITKSFYKNKYSPSIPAIINNGELISDSKQKAEVLNNFFVSQTQLLNSVSRVVPSLSNPTCLLSSITASELTVYNLLRHLDISKASGEDGISNRILKCSCEGIYKPLTKLINLSFSLGQYPSCWKLANVVPLFKGDNRQYKSNYRPISLLPCLSKICEKIVFSELYEFLSKQNFFHYFQSGFRPGDSTVMQLIYIVNKIYNALEKGHEVRAVFLDISKAFDKVWHKGLLAKLKSIGISGPLYSWFESYLTNRYQRVSVNGFNSDWRKTEAGVPQGSVLGPLLFLVYINDISDDVSSDCFLFADDSLLLNEVTSPITTAYELNLDLQSIATWANNWLVTMNADKTKNMIFSSKVNKPIHPPLIMSNNIIEDVISHDHLGVTLTSNLSWRSHIWKIHQKASKKINMIKGLKFKLGRSTLETLYKSLIRSTLEYADVVWDGCSKSDSDLLESLQFEAARIVTGAMKGTHRENLLCETAWVTLKNRRKDHKLIMMYKLLNNTAPTYLLELCPTSNNSRTNYNLRTSCNLSIPPSRTERHKNSFLPSAIKLWNLLSPEVRNCQNVAVFKKRLIKWNNYLVRNRLYYFGDRYLAVLHTRLRLGNSALNYNLYRMNCVPSPLCACGISNETVEHFFLHCDRFAAARNILLTSAAQIVGITWSNASNRTKLNFMLNGIPSKSLCVNSLLFTIVQTYIAETKRFL